MGKADKSKLINRPRVDDGKVTVPGVGDFRIRPLTRAETLKVHDTTEEHGKAEGEALLIHLACTDPAWTLAEARQWQMEPGASGEIQAVSQAIAVISGLTPDAGKNAYKSAG